MLVSVADFLARYRDFDVRPHDAIANVLLDAEEYFAGDIWEEYPLKHRKAIKLYAAHILTVEWAETAQTVSAAFSVASGSGGGARSPTSTDLELTAYGRQLLDLIKTLPRMAIA